MTDKAHSHEPTVYSEDAIEILLDGSRRQIDGLLLKSLNNLNKTFVAFRDEEFRPHVEEENIMKLALGDPVEVERRRKWLDLQIKKEEACANMRGKILESTLTKYVPVILVAVTIAAVTGIMDHAYTWWSSWKVYAANGK